MKTITFVFLIGWLTMGCATQSGMDRNPSYYESQNKQYVTAWNELFHSTGGRGPFGSYIDYQFSEDYGLDLNYELYWYFKYIESIYGKRYNFP